jgi:hypothetical protein
VGSGETRVIGEQLANEILHRPDRLKPRPFLAQGCRHSIAPLLHRPYFIDTGSGFRF